MWELIGAFDSSLFTLITSAHSPALDQVATWFEAGGGGGLLWLALGIGSFIRRQDRAAAWRVLLVVGCAYLAAAAVIKPVVARERPVPLWAAPASISPVAGNTVRRTLPPIPASMSFPSDRAAAAFGAAVAVSRMWPKTTMVWWTLAVLIGYARIYVGHHYPLDVLGGGLLGMAIAFWVLGGRHPATYAQTLPRPLPQGVVVRP